MWWVWWRRSRSGFSLGGEEEEERGGGEGAGEVEGVEGWEERGVSRSIFFLSWLWFFFFRGRDGGGVRWVGLKVPRCIALECWNLWRLSFIFYFLLTVQFRTAQPG